MALYNEDFIFFIEVPPLFISVIHHSLVILAENWTTTQCDTQECNVQIIGEDEKIKTRLNENKGYKTDNERIREKDRIGNRKQMKRYGRLRGKSAS